MVSRIIHITECLSDDRRWLFGVLEQIDSFTLFNCKGQSVIHAIDRFNRTLVVDNIDDAQDGNAIVNEALVHLEHVNSLIIVESSGLKISVGSNAIYAYEHWFLGDSCDSINHDGCRFLNTVPSAVKAIQVALASNLYSKL